MTKKLLITDSFFVTLEDIQTLHNSGYEIVHLDKPAATEAELINVIKDISVYILGGIEEVTDAVIAAADKLEAIIFCGVDYDKYITGAHKAIHKGIKLYNAPAANAIAVAEFAIGTAIMMQRQLVGISRLGTKKYVTTGSIQGSTIGIIGAGNIGSKIIDAITPFDPKEVIFYNRSRRDLSGRQVDISELVETSDVIFVALPKKAGLVLNSELISKLKLNSLVVSISPMNLIDFDALLPRLQSGEVRAAVDWPSPSDEFDILPLETWYSVNSHSAYNTAEAVRLVGESVINKAIELINE